MMYSRSSSNAVTSGSVGGCGSTMASKPTANGAVLSGEPTWIQWATSVFDPRDCSSAAAGRNSSP